MNRLIGIIILIVFSFSCRKHYATISIIKPINGHVFTIGEQIEVKADLYDPDALSAEYAIITSGINNSDTVMNFVDHTFTGDASVYHLSRSFICELQTKYKILIIANGYSSIARDSIYVSSN